LKLRLHLHEIIPQTIQEHPELAALAILDAALHATSLALDVAHPDPWWAEEADPDIHPHQPPCPNCQKAQAIVFLAAELRNEINRYRPAEETQRQFPLPFDGTPMKRQRKATTK
jgi:hypothetical protein